MVVEEMHKEAAEVWGKLHVEVGKLRMACSFVHRCGVIPPVGLFRLLTQ